MTGFTEKQKQAALTRDGECVPHGGSCGGPLVVHHRAGRGMGGSKLANRLSNALAVCSAWNQAVESEPGVAELARLRGWKISRFMDPLAVPVWVPFYGAWMWLTDDGDYLERPREEEP